MKIRVLQRHIDDGRRGICSACPVALALNEATGMEWMVGFRRASAFGHANSIILPDRAQEAIRAIDHGRGVPFEFDIPLELA